MHGRAKGLTPGEPAYVRFTTVHRVGHTFMLIAFLGLALTGMPLKYSHSPWAKYLAGLWGGFASTGFWHRFFAIIVFGCFAAYLVRLIRLFFAGRRRGVPLLKLVFGPDSPVPTWRDFADFFAMIRWFLGLGPKPSFERWAYWEKLDFWGAAADIVIIGFTGLMLWFPNFFCRFLPAVSLNVAQVIHSTQALLATGFVFAIHFFNTHLRPDKFPADMSVMTGRLSEEEFKEDRLDLFERLRRQGDLEAIRTVSPGRRALWLIRAGGLLALVLGLLLLAGMVVAGLGG
jgi:cytochrome b subunit of formate dehydrogenase